MVVAQRNGPTILREATNAKIEKMLWDEENNIILIINT